jgi:hypothetical protein
MLKDVSVVQLDRLAELEEIAPHLVLVFGSLKLMSHPSLQEQLALRFSDAQRIGCSTAGEIFSIGVGHGTVVVTAIHFTQPMFRVATAELASAELSREAGMQLAGSLAAPELKMVWLLGQGLNINGSALVAGMSDRLGKQVPICGGLAGDDGEFKSTATLCNAGVSDHRLVAIGFYGDKVVHAHGSFGGWRAFGPARKVTRCVGNILYELDGEAALTVYKRYLGDYAKDLPASGLLFPFEMMSHQGEATGLIRTILGIDEQQGCLTLAGEINPEGYLRLMHAHTDALIDGVEDAAGFMQKSLSPHAGPGLALLVSCAGRLMVMGGRVDEEVEAVATVLGSHVTLAGFYSYGEICPAAATLECQLQNQTMTMALLAEVADG